MYTKQGFPGAFRVVANDNKLGGTLGSYAVDKLGAKNIAVIDDRTAYGQGVADEFVKGAKARRASRSSPRNSPPTRPPTSPPS